MDSLSIEEISEALTTAAIPCVEEFIRSHANETFFGFAVELLTESGAFQMGAGSIESFEPVRIMYKEKFNYCDEDIEEIKWNNQEWPYFSFNYESQVWNKKWQLTENKLLDYLNYLSSLNDEAHNSKYQEFNRTFISAGKIAFSNIQDSGCLNRLKKTNDYREFVFDHHDVF